MYFLNDEHKLNYEYLMIRFPLAKEDPEYQVAIYSVAFPKIYDAIGGDTGRYPFSWKRRGDEVEKLEMDEDGQPYSSFHLEFQDGDINEDGLPYPSDIYNELDDIDCIIADIGEALYNGCSCPSLYKMSVLFSHQKKYWQIFDQMIAIRRGEINY